MRPLRWEAVRDRPPECGQRGGLAAALPPDNEKVRNLQGGKCDRLKRALAEGERDSEFLRALRGGGERGRDVPQRDPLG